MTWWRESSLEKLRPLTFSLSLKLRGSFTLTYLEFLCVASRFITEIWQAFIGPSSQKLG